MLNFFLKSGKNTYLNHLHVLHISIFIFISEIVEQITLENLVLKKKLKGLVFLTCFIRIVTIVFSKKNPTVYLLLIS